MDVLTERADGAAPGTRRRASPYREVLRLPGVPALTMVAMLTRIPTGAAAITLTLHVVLTLELGYAAAGTVGAASTIGMAIGAPLLGRLIDMRGLRTVVAIGVLAEALFWSLAPTLPYPALMVGGLACGVLGLPVYSVIRQAIAATVPEQQRRPAYAIDSMSVELSYIVGPAVGTFLVLQFGSTVALWAVGAGWLISGAALWLLNPPTRVPAEADDPPAPPLREWLDRRLFAALLATFAAVVVVFGTELSLIAGLQGRGQEGWIPAVLTVWCLASLTGGFCYGALPRSPTLPLLTGGMAAATLPVALGGPWWSFALLLIPAGLLCAPTLAASAVAVANLAPEHARGVVSGLHGSSITLGAAAGTPLAGLLIDLASPAVAIVTVGLIGVAVAVGGWLLGDGLSRIGRSSAGSQRR